MKKTNVKMAIIALSVIITATVILTAVMCISGYYITGSHLSCKTNISDTNNHVNGELVICKYEVGTSLQDCEDVNNAFIRTYDELQKYAEQFNEITVWAGSIDGTSLFDYYKASYFENYNLAIFAYDGATKEKIYNIQTITRDNNTVNVNINLVVSHDGGSVSPYYNFRFIPLDKSVKYVNFNITRTEDNCTNPWDVDLEKPVIYLYPQEETNVNVKLGYKDAITCIYPKYNDGWNVLAKPNGDLIDLSTGRYQYSLYYESTCPYPYEVTDVGFVIERENIVSFLEEKLSVLGLSEREADEFIIYWLPQLESNKYNYIRFATMEEIENNMPLDISPKPDSIIRVIMLFKGLDEPIPVKEQVLTAPERTGFTVVEWGGSKLK